MDEFYRNISATGVSAATGKGIDKLFECIDNGAEEYRSIYLPELLKKIEKNEEKSVKAQQEQLERLKLDMKKEST